MSKKISLRKTYSVYASKIHLATMTFPFIKRELKKGAIIKTIFEKDISENMNQVIKNVNINTKMKEKINNIDWKQTDIEKIKETLNDMEKLLKKKNNIDIMILGTNIFIEKVNELIDLWTKINLNELENDNISINVINCYSFEENKTEDNIKNKHEFILKTKGIEAIYSDNNLRMAN